MTDFIPMHFRRGDITNINGWPCEILWASHEKCIAQDRREKTFHLWDYANNQISDLSPEEAQHFLDQPQSGAGEDIENQTTKKENNMRATPVSVADLNSYKDGQVIPCFEGVITKLYEAKTGTSKGRPWSFQGGFIKDMNGDEHRITFAGASQAQDEKEAKGKRIRLTPSSIRGKIKGLTLKIEDNDKNPNEPYRKIQVDEGCKIEFVNGSASQPSSSQSHAPSSPSSSSQRHTPQHESTVEDRVTGYFGVLAAVNSSFNANAGRLPALSPSDLKDISTYISMTFRGDYGAYAPPVFRLGREDCAAGAPQSTDGGDAPAAASVAEKPWKSFIHPKRGKPLGEIPLQTKDKVGGLASLIKWAINTDPGALADAAREMHAALTEAGEDIGLGLVVEHLLADLRLNADDVEFELQKRGFSDCSAIDNEAGRELIQNFDELVASIKAPKETNELPE